MVFVDAVATTKSDPTLLKRSPQCIVPLPELDPPQRRSSGSDVITLKAALVQPAGAQPAV
jgi:hypothetical protein